MTFRCCFGFQWIPNFGDYHDYTCLLFFDIWLCVLHTLTQMCLVMPCTCITRAYFMHTLVHLSCFCISITLDLCYYMFSSYNMILWHFLCSFLDFCVCFWTNLVLIKFVFLSLCCCTCFFAMWLFFCRCIVVPLAVKTMWLTLRYPLYQRGPDIRLMTPTTRDSRLPWILRLSPAFLRMHLL